jgi:DNA mismatch endonuclease (patch repair protein)
MQANKGRDTKPELALRRAAHALGLRYRVSVRPLPKVRRTADMVFTKAKVAVFMDGCFWHGCPQHHTKAATNADYWAEKVLRNRERDAETDRLLTEAGWKVVRVWEHEDPTDAALRVSETVKRDRSARITRTTTIRPAGGDPPS